MHGIKMVLTCAFELLAQLVRAHEAIWSPVAQMRQLKELQHCGWLVDLAPEVSIFEVQEEDFAFNSKAYSTLATRLQKQRKIAC